MKKSASQDVAPDASGALDALSHEERVFRPLPKVVLGANLSPRGLEAAQDQAARDYLKFWEEAACELDWYGRWDTVLDDSQAPFYKWFTGGKCNIVYNALDRHIASPNKNKLALIWEGEPGDSRKFTYYELYREVNRFANALRSLGVGKGDRVVIYMPPVPETVVAMLATAKIGAAHSLVFAGFSAKSLRNRIHDAKAKMVVTVDGFYRNGRVVNVKSVVDEALIGIRGGCAETVVVVHRAGVDIELTEPRDVRYEDVVRQERSDASTEVMDAEDTLFLLYSSGTTGKPKGMVHTHGGYMVGINRTFRWVFDIKPTDIFYCTADPGWITGHSYVVYAPLIAGTTTVMYEGHPLYPQADRLWDIIARYGVTIFYTAPTLIRMLMRFGPQYPKRHDLSTVRLLGSVGEPINPEAWLWLHKHIGRSECPIMDTWWQTETGMCMISPLPISPIKPGSVGKPLPGVEAAVVDKNGQPVPPGMGGFLVIKKPWPAMVRNLYNSPEGFRETYWDKIPGVYFAGDMARKDEDGFYFIQGRADDVLVIAGHRLGNAELEAALETHKAVNEAAIIGVPDPIKGEAAKAFVVLNDNWRQEFENEDELVKELIKHIRRELGPIAVIKAVEFRDKLPKTRSGKIMRRVLKAEELGQELGDISVLED
ncbi:MAG: acetate--CoA ligase [Desulfovibrionaceae bacterium]|nr:acetate--CoA ligase [Desulfovibrionaceae bacterium]MBF0512574.1 acetate--CoA ligase [Desulfovibrionaceae bacterium]